MAKFAGKKPPDALEKPGVVATARSEPVGTGGLPVVARIDTVRFGVVPVQLLQKRSRSTLVSLPETPGTKVWPAQDVLLNPKPLLVTVRFCWSTALGLARTTSPALAVKSTFVLDPAWKS